MGEPDSSLGMVFPLPTDMTYEKREAGQVSPCPAGFIG